MKEHTYQYKRKKNSYVTIRLGEDTLSYSNGSEHVKLQLSEIREVNLCTPRPGEVLCRLKDTKGKWYSIVNRSFHGFGKFEEHNTEFCEIVKLLHEKLADDPKRRFTFGSQGLYLWMLVGMIVIGVMFLVFVGLLIYALVLGRGIKFGIIAGPAVGLILLLPFALYTLSRKPRDYKPSEMDLTFQSIHQNNRKK